MTRITRTLARVRGRPLAFRDVYLSKIINLLIEKTSKEIANLNVSYIFLIIRMDQCWKMSKISLPY
jgi:hypothetical protein